MMSGKGKRRLEGWLFALRRYLAFFLLMAFVISCCMLLFLNELSAATGIALTKDKIESAAKLTFVNILFLSLLCTVIDGPAPQVAGGAPGEDDCEGGRADHEGRLFGADSAAPGHREQQWV